MAHKHGSSTKVSVITYRKFCMFHVLVNLSLNLANCESGFESESEFRLFRGLLYVHEAHWHTNMGRPLLLAKVSIVRTGKFRTNVLCCLFLELGYL